MAITLTSPLEKGSTLVQFAGETGLPLLGDLYIGDSSDPNRLKSGYLITSLDSTTGVYTAELFNPANKQYEAGTPVTILEINNNFFVSIENPAQTDWVWVPFGFTASNLKITAVIDNPIDISFNGRDVHGKVRSGVVCMFYNMERRGLFYRGSASGYVDIYAWRNYRGDIRPAI